MRHSTSRTMKNALLLTGAGIFSQLVAFVYRIFLTQLIGAEVLGLYQLMMPVYSVLLSLSSVGLTSAVSNLSARYQVVGNTRAVWQLRNLALRLFFLLAALPGILLLLFSDAVSVYILGDARTQLGLLLLVPCLFLTGIENIQKYYFYGVGTVRPAAVTELIEQVLRSVLVLGLLYTLHPSSPEKMVGLIVLGMVLCEIFSAVTQSVLFRRNLPPRERVRGERVPTRKLCARVMTIAGPVGFTALLGNLIGAANSVLVPRLLVRSGLDLSEAMSQYGVMFGMTLPMLFLPTALLAALNLLLAPKLAESMALGNRKAVRWRIRKAMAAANLVLIPSIALLAVIGPGLGERLYQDARVGNHMPLLAVGVLFSCWGGLLSNALSGLNLQNWAAKIALLSDAVQLFITCLTVVRPEIRLLGFVWGYVISAGLGALLCWWKISQETGLKLPVFDWFVAPVLSSVLAAAYAQLFRSALLRSGCGALGADFGALILGLLLYLAALQAQGVSLRRLLRGEGLAFQNENR